MRSAAEIKRSGSSVPQVYRTSALMELDLPSPPSRNQSCLGTESFPSADRGHRPVLAVVPANTARMYRCVPVDVSDNMCCGWLLKIRWILVRVDEVGFVVKKIFRSSSPTRRISPRSSTRRPPQTEKSFRHPQGWVPMKTSARDAAAAEGMIRVATGLASTKPPIVRYVNLVPAPGDPGCSVTFTLSL